MIWVGNLARNCTTEFGCSLAILQDFVPHIHARILATGDLNYRIDLEPEVGQTDWFVLPHLGILEPCPSVRSASDSSTSGPGRSSSSTTNC